MAVKLLDSVREVNQAFRKKDINVLRAVSDALTKEAILTEDKEMMDLSIVAYSLAKILEKPHYSEYTKWVEFLRNVSSHLYDGAVALEKGQKAELGRMLNLIITEIAAVDEEMKRFTQKLIEKARIKKAAQIYGYGFSLGRAAELAGIEKGKVLGYVGKTMAHEFETFRTMSIAERLEHARTVFRR